MFTDELTVEKTCIHAVNVRNAFHHRMDLDVTRIFTLVNTSAQNVADVVRVLNI